MNKPIALFFSVVTILFLLGIAMAISYRSLWMTLLLSLVSVGFIGFGFITKARMRRRSNQ